MSQEREIKITEGLYARIVKRARECRFESPDLLADHLLKELDSDTSQLILLGLLSPEVEAHPYVSGKTLQFYHK